MLVDKLRERWVVQRSGPCSATRYDGLPDDAAARVVSCLNECSFCVTDAVGIDGEMRACDLEEVRETTAVSEQPTLRAGNSDAETKASDALINAPVGPKAGRTAISVEVDEDEPSRATGSVLIAAHLPSEPILTALSVDKGDRTPCLLHEASGDTFVEVALDGNGDERC